MDIKDKNLQNLKTLFGFGLIYVFVQTLIHFRRYELASNTHNLSSFLLSHTDT